jgi:hypothetical protein
LPIFSGIWQDILINFSDSINIAFQKSLNIAKPVITGINKTQYNQNIVLTTTEEFDATLLQDHEVILEKFFQFESSKIDAKWCKILVHDIPIAEFSSNNGMELLQKEIETFNPKLKLAVKPRRITTERIRNSGKMHAIVRRNFKYYYTEL